MASGGQRDIQIETNLTRTVRSEFYKSAKSGLAFVVSEELTNATTGDTSAVSFTNPAGSGTTAVFALTQVAASAPSNARIYDVFSSGPTGGTAATIENIILDTNGTDDDGVVTASVGPSFTATNTHLSEPIGGGRGGNAIGGGMDAATLLLEPGRSIVIECEKRETDGDEVTITAKWFEVPVVFSNVSADITISEAY